ncbi:imidazoleglycerol-phosphate dehydratase HisB [Thermohalobacter berrensis]|uniref:Imidazoleglycerol-phosphate dehydratase n=1 Tax=Thermohalobacter berrensis TaxID=99594 RepID=A0A419T673_9FIRM|nr:imidazoleglycerol-phosphate dehydratase HisB [Thermohalobacter berrensis]RKD32925.1 imidazoleglycerol-phosphate dehydratase [Thermohalobacter berrensis]
MRKSEKTRRTLETDIKLILNIDGRGKSNIKTGIGFFDHMLTLFSKHGLFDLEVDCQGDLHVDGHHTVEDIGIVLGKAFKDALGDKKGIRRYSHVYTPMDESLTCIVVDISGRPYLAFDVDFTREKVGEFDTELVEEFLRGFVNSSKITLHVKLVEGKNTHHIIESIFKGLGRALDKATVIDERINGVMTTKGVI